MDGGDRNSIILSNLISITTLLKNAVFCFEGRANASLGQNWCATFDMSQVFVIVVVAHVLRVE